MEKTPPDTTSDANRLPRASCPPLRVHFGGSWVPFWRPRLPRASPAGPGNPPPGGPNNYIARDLGPQGDPGAPREPREASGSQFGSNSRASGGDVRHFFPSPNASRKLLRDRFLFIPLASPTKRYKRQRDATRDPRNWRSFPRQTSPSMWLEPLSRAGRAPPHLRLLPGSSFATVFGSPPLRRQQSATKDNATQHENQGTGEVFPGRVGEG